MWLSIPFRIPATKTIIKSIKSVLMSFNSFPDSSKVKELIEDKREAQGLLNLSIPFRIPVLLYVNPIEYCIVTFNSFPDSRGEAGKVDAGYFG